MAKIITDNAHLVLMGVAGAGKTAVGRVLAHRLGYEFKDGDDFHPTKNIEKMRAGIPLADEDRFPWLEKMNLALRAQERRVILACSALRRSYRDYLSRDINLRFVHLKVSPELALQRMNARALKEQHFMPPSLLPNQFKALEEPGHDEALIITDTGFTPDEVADQIMRQIQAV